MIISRLIAFLGLLFLPSIFYAQSVLFLPEQRITIDTFYNYTPRILAEGDTIQIFFHQAGHAMHVRSTDGGASWSQPRNIYSDTLANNGVTRRIVSARENIYAVWTTCDTCRSQSNFWTTFRRSTNAGATFENYTRLFPATPFSLTASDSVVLFQYAPPAGGGFRLLISTNRGIDWESKPVHSRAFQDFFLYENHLHLFQTGDNLPRFEILYSSSTNLGTSWGDEVLLSTNDGWLSYKPAFSGTENQIIHLVWMDGKYGSTSGFSTSVLFRWSSDYGATWQPEQLLTSIPSALDPRISSQNNFVGVVWANEAQPFRGVSLRFSTNRGMNWLAEYPVSDSMVQAGGPDISISRNKLHVVWSDDRTGRAQIFYRQGVFGATSVFSHKEQPQSTALFSSYPNPFNRETVISYFLADQSAIDLSVFDVLGREVARIFVGVEQGGIHKKKFNGSMLASGTYFLKIQSSERVQTTPLIIIK